MPDNRGDGDGLLKSRLCLDEAPEEGLSEPCERAVAREVSDVWDRAVSMEDSAVDGRDRGVSGPSSLRDRFLTRENGLEGLPADPMQPGASKPS